MPDQSPAQINFAAFDSKQGKRSIWEYITLAGVVIFVFFIGAMVYISIKNQAGPDTALPNWLGFGFMGSFILLLGALIMFARQQENVQKARVAEFIMENGWQVMPDAGGANADVATSLLGVGGQQSVSSIFQGTYMDKLFVMLMYKYVTGSGRSREVHCYLNLHFKLQRQFPLLVLDDKRNNYFKLVSDLPSRIPNGKTLQPEGDFSTRFRLTVLPGSEQDVLQVLTPDFMAELMQQSAIADSEIEADNLFVMRQANNYDKNSLQNMFAFAGVMLKNLAELSDTWQASSSPAMVEEMADTALQPRATLLLKHRRKINYLSVAGLLIYLCMFFFANR